MVTTVKPVNGHFGTTPIYKGCPISEVKLYWYCPIGTTELVLYSQLCTLIPKESFYCILYIAFSVMIIALWLMILLHYSYKVAIITTCLSHTWLTVSTFILTDSMTGYVNNNEVG